MSFTCATTLPVPKENVAIALSSGAFGSHIGIIFNTAKDGLHILHLRFHKDLIAEAFPQSNFCCWIAAPANVPPIASKALVAIVRAISKRLPTIKYGVNFMAAKGSFDASGAYKAPKGSDGLTCATFVVEIFRAASLPLIKEESWLPTAENILWGQAVCTLMTKVGTEPEHIKHVLGNIAGLRIRPEEVAAASIVPTLERAIEFDRASGSAIEVMKLLNMHCAELVFLHR